MANTKSVNHAERAHPRSLCFRKLLVGLALYAIKARLEEEFGVDKPSPYAWRYLRRMSYQRLLFATIFLKTLSDEQFEEQAIKVFENELYQAWNDWLRAGFMLTYVRWAWIVKTWNSRCNLNYWRARRLTWLGSLSHLVLVTLLL